MNELSCQATRILLEAAEESGISIPRLLEGFRYNAAYLRDPSHTIAWDDVAELFDRVGEIVGSERALGELGERVVHVPSYAFMRHFAGALVSARQLNYAAFHW